MCVYSFLLLFSSSLMCFCVCNFCIWSHTYSQSTQLDGEFNTIFVPYIKRLCMCSTFVFVNVLLNVCFCIFWFFFFFFGFCDHTASHLIFLWLRLAWTNCRSAIKIVAWKLAVTAFQLRSCVCANDLLCCSARHGFLSHAAAAAAAAFHNVCLLVFIYIVFLNKILYSVYDWRLYDQVLCCCIWFGHMFTKDFCCCCCCWRKNHKKKATF